MKKVWETAGGNGREMSEFSQKLSDYIKEKDTNVYMLAKYCGYDRANMYKLISGKRNAPDEQFVRKLSEYLHLSPAEEEELVEKYEISVMGYESYHRRKNILQFLSEFTLLDDADVSMASMDVTVKFDLKEKQNVILRNTYELEAALFWMIAQETRNPQGMLRMIAQPEAGVIGEVLRLCGRTEHNIRIDHIICLSGQADKMEGGKLYNLECLKKILPLYNYNYDYHTWYYYGNTNYVDTAFVMFPYMVLTSEYACLMSADIRSGCITKDKELIQMLTKRFNDYQKKARRLVNCIDNIMQQFDVVGTAVSTKYNGYNLQMEPCIMSFLDREMIEKYLGPQLPGREQLVEKTAAYCENLSAQSITYIFSMDGLFHFLETGNIRELDPGLYNRPEMEDRIKILERILHPEGGQKVRLLKQKIGHPETDVNILVTSEHGLLRVAVPSKNVFLDMILEESGVLHSFYDFCENLSEVMFYDPQEAEKLILERVEMMRQG